MEERIHAKAEHCCPSASAHFCRYTGKSWKVLARTGQQIKPHRCLTPAFDTLKQLCPDSPLGVNNCSRIYIRSYSNASWSAQNNGSKHRLTAYTVKTLAYWHCVTSWTYTLTRSASNFRARTARARQTQSATLARNIPATISGRCKKAHRPL